MINNIEAEVLCSSLLGGPVSGLEISRHAMRIAAWFNVQKTKKNKLNKTDINY